MQRVERHSREVRIDALNQFGITRFEGRIIRRARMPGIESLPNFKRGGMLHERDTATFDGIGDDDLRLAFDLFCFGKRLFDLAEIMPVNADDMPAEGRELFDKVAQVNDLGDGFVGLHLVVVNDDGEVVHLVMRGDVQGFVILTFLQFAVAGHDVNAPAVAIVFLRPCHAAPLRDAHAQRTGVGFHAAIGNIGMSVQAVETAQG